MDFLLLSHKLVDFTKNRRLKMFSRVLKPVTTVAIQNGAKNFSTTSEVIIGDQKLVVGRKDVGQNFV